MCYKYAHKGGWHHPGRRHHGHGRHKWRSKMQAFSQGWISPPVNIQEMEDRYELFLYAPELTKEDFKISVVNRILKIEVDKALGTDDPLVDWRRREYRPEGFSREFELNERIDTAGISAQYQEGVLQVSLPKLEDFHSSNQEINVA